MAAVLQPHINSSFYYASDGLRRNLNDARSSNRHYVTHELAGGIDRINNGVNHMRLDSDLLTSSREWGNKFNLEDLNREKAEAASRLAQSTSYMNQYKDNMTVPRVQNMQENQVRELHQWAGDSLHKIKDDLHPYASSAQSRINQFCDHIGVTDRFTGYRNNLTRGSRDPTKLGMAWLNPAKQQHYEEALSSKTAEQVFLPASLPKRRTDEKNASYTVMDLNQTQGNLLSKSAPPRARSIQEQCGINMVFPGITEYMKRYNMKKLPEKVTAYRINPTPDISIYGRPSAVVEYTPNHTEYQVRYEWPQCSKIVKKPWLRK